jgi:hypothetical protein
MLRFRQLVAATSLLLSLTWATSTSAQQVADRPHLTIEQLIDIKHPSDPTW